MILFCYLRVITASPRKKTQSEMVYSYITSLKNIKTEILMLYLVKKTTFIMFYYYNKGYVTGKSRKHR